VARSVALVLLAVALSTPAAGADLPEPGQVAERVVCRARPEQSYALSLPSTYAPDHPAPILYLLDARGRALLAIERFRAAAETYGWILASAYGSRSDTTDDPNTPALQAMWNDTRARLAVDPRRTYLGGLSGTARVTVALAAQAPAAIAGVIGCSGGLPGEGMNVKDFRSVYFGTAGERDFNYYEMRALDATLEKAHVTHRIAFFDGGHDWPPSPVATRALTWMELQAMKTGLRPKDPELSARLLAAELAAADAEAAAGHPAAAQQRAAQAAEDFLGLTDVAAARASAAALDSPAVRRAIRQAESRDERDHGTLNTLARKLQAAMRSPDLPASAQLAAELGIPALKHRAATATPEERMSAERLLANLRVETSFYLPEQRAGKGDFAHARLALAVAAEIDPDDPFIDYNLAGVDARSGQTRRARRELEQALAKGFRRFQLLDEDPDFAALRADPEFQEWLAAARRSAAPPATTPTPSSGVSAPSPPG
jgi:predicted esterase